eukprot:gene12404-26098_t
MQTDIGSDGKSLHANTSNDVANDNSLPIVNIPSRLRNRFIILFAIIILFFIIAALTASLPSTKPYGQIGAENLKALNGADMAWMLMASALVLLMTPGLAFFYGKPKLAQVSQICITLSSCKNVSIRSNIYVFSFSLVFGKDANGSGIMGYPMSHFMYADVGASPDPSLAPTIPLSIFSMFQLMFAMITPILISGALAERVNFASWLVFLCI